VTVHREHKAKRGNHQDAINSTFVIKLLSPQVSGIIMPITRTIRPCPTACGVLHWLCRLRLAVVLYSCVVSCVHSEKITVRLILLMMGIMMPETC